MTEPVKPLDREAREAIRARVACADCTHDASRHSDHDGTEACDEPGCECVEFHAQTVDPNGIRARWEAVRIHGGWGMANRLIREDIPALLDALDREREQLETVRALFDHYREKAEAESSDLHSANRVATAKLATAQDRLLAAGARADASEKALQKAEGALLNTEIALYEHSKAWRESALMRTVGAALVAVRAALAPKGQEDGK